MVQAVVVIGGGALSTRALEAIRDDAVIIAADSGLDHAVEAGLRPTVLVGDLDSISASGRMWAYAREVEIHEHPADKDATDTEIAIERALQVPDVRQLLVIGGVDAAELRFGIRERCKRVDQTRWRYVRTRERRRRGFGKERAHAPWPDQRVERFVPHT